MKEVGTCPACGGHHVVVDGPPGGIVDVTCKSCGRYFDSWFLKKEEVSKDEH